MRYISLSLIGSLACACGGSAGDPAIVPVPVGASPVRGPADAWVTLIEFGDFQCSYCGAEEPVVENLVLQYPTDLRLVFKNLPLTSIHSHAQAAAIAAECADEQGLFWPMHDLLYGHQRALDSASLQSYAVTAGVNLPNWQSCLGSQPPVDVINADTALSDSVGVQGTPTFFVNGQKVEGAVPKSDLQDDIETARTAAENSGVPRASYYDMVILGQPG